MGVLKIYLFSLLLASISFLFINFIPGYIVDNKSVEIIHRNILRESIVRLIAKKSIGNQKIKNSWDQKKLNDFEDALRYGYEKYGIPELVTLAFINHESSMYVYAAGKNKDKNGNIKSIDYGLAQINKSNISKSDMPSIFSVKTNLKYFFSVYRGCSKKYGMFTPRSIVCYNYPLLAKKGSNSRVNSYIYTKYILESYNEVKKNYSVVLDSVTSKIY